MAPNTFFIIMAISLLFGVLLGLFSTYIYAFMRRVYQRYLTRGMLEEVDIANRADSEDKHEHRGI